MQPPYCTLNLQYQTYCTKLLQRTYCTNRNNPRPSAKRRGGCPQEGRQAGRQASRTLAETRVTQQGWQAPRRALTVMSSLRSWRDLLTDSLSSNIWRLTASTRMVSSWVVCLRALDTWDWRATGRTLIRPQQTKTETTRTKKEWNQWYWKSTGLQWIAASLPDFNRAGVSDSVDIGVGIGIGKKMDAIALLPTDANST